MTNIEYLNSIGELGNIRERLGAKDEYDTSRDERINTMTAQTLAATYAGWHLGDEGWGHSIVNIYKGAIKQAGAEA